MGLFCPNSLIGTRYRWVSLLKKFNALNLIKHSSYFNARIPYLCLVFSIYLQWLLSYKQFVDALQNKSYERYPGPMLPPDGRNWQLIYLHCNKFSK
jgi:hypothetical protein